MPIHINCPGLNGRNYQLEMRPIGSWFYEVSGVYVFCKPAANGNWDAIYVGETDNLNQRLNTALQSHHMWPSCALHGATHIASIVVGGERSARLALETELRHSLNPPCNRQAA
jgi:hypothetical protein